MNGRAVRLVPYLLAFFSSLCIMILELVASRLVARHVGASLSVWTSVIGIMLGGICLGNVLGGRLADRIDPARALGPLYALGAALTLGCLWINAGIGFVPGLHYLPLSLETILVVSLDFLVPGTILGMIGPVVAKMAVEQARHSGGALGDVYFFGAVGSIAGTFLAGFVLMYLAPTATIVALVAAALALLAAALIGEVGGMVLGLGTAAALALGAFLTMIGSTGSDVKFGSLSANGPTLVGTVLAIGLAGRGLRRLRSDIVAGDLVAGEPGRKTSADVPVKLTDLSALAFVSSLGFMALEMVAGRLVTRNLGSSIYGWTSVIGVLLGGLSIGNWLGGRIANRVRNEAQASNLFLVASIFTASILLAETPRAWMVRNPYEYFVEGKVGEPLAGGVGPILTMVSGTVGWPWALRILFWVSVEFLLPAIAMGTVGPVVAKLAVERVRASTKGTGAAIGQVYAWGMVGSILGTFLSGFLLINVFGTKGVILLLATGLAIAATILGRVWHAAWAGIPLGLCVIAFLPSVIPAKSGSKIIDSGRAFLLNQGENWGLREESHDVNTEKNAIAFVDESNYYYIKITNQNLDGDHKRTLVLDNLIHGYFIKDHPERLDYDYEHIYALVTRRVMAAKAKAAKSGKVADQPLSTLFLGGGSYTFPRYLQHEYPKTTADVAEIDPAVTEANHRALWLPRDTTIKTFWGDARQFVANRTGVKYDLIFGDAFNDFSVPWHLTTKEFNDKINGLLTDDGVYMINIIDKYVSDHKAAFAALDQGTNARYGERVYIERALEAAGVNEAKRIASDIVIGLDKKGLGVNTSRLARVASEAVAGVNKIVPVTGLEALILAAFEKGKIPLRGNAAQVKEAIEEILARDKDVKKFPSRIPDWAAVAAQADVKYAEDWGLLAHDAAMGVYQGREFGSFLGSWVETARKSFGPHVYVFGTASEPGHGQRETFVVVASHKPLDLALLGMRPDDPHFFDRSSGDLVAPKAYNADHMAAVKLRSRGIILTDDYAPVENLLAPVAKTRAEDDD
ncbi:MAG: hypothetical protein JWN86_3957 [Planctomycetota bacterium]|nr:hypothetical protein [Planctomycetota bacterium]